jgi:hypothetical protein
MLLSLINKTNKSNSLVVWYGSLVYVIPVIEITQIST